MGGGEVCKEVHGFGEREGRERDFVQLFRDRHRRRASRPSPPRADRPRTWPPSPGPSSPEK